MPIWAVRVRALPVRRHRCNEFYPVARLWRTLDSGGPRRSAGDLLAFARDATGAAPGGLDIGSIIGQIASGGAGGGILMVVVGLIKQAMGGQKAV